MSPDLTELFNVHAGKWEQFCSHSSIQHSSNPEVRKGCEPYNNIVGLGKDAVNLLIERYAKARGNTVVGIAWAFAIERILQDAGENFEIPSNLRQNPERVKQYVLFQLDRRKSEYARA